MLSFTRTRSQQRSNRSMSLGGMDYADPKKKNNLLGKIMMVSALTALCILMLKKSPNFNTPSQFSSHDPDVTHVLVTGGAGYIGSHAALRLLKDFYRVTIVDNLSRGNLGAISVLQNLFPEPGRLQFIYADLGDAKAVNRIFSENAFDARSYSLFPFLLLRFCITCKKATGVAIKVELLPRRPGDYAEVYSDPTKIKIELNWTAKYTNLQQSLQVAWRWQKAHLNGYETTPLLVSA
ncbi:UDP-arabinose 4-epimerase 1 [Striga hermonthica]|uniref:UDP-arabinose 4-epimerase 1 n=1 Tax=Striga hermonthica TaxID=68872 RepID=A0A9N7NLN2_STRHE|nr:UDP-arabinose 4-epimerase 1 [Striga hermonthica]